MELSSDKWPPGSSQGWDGGRRGRVVAEWLATGGELPGVPREAWQGGFGREGGGEQGSWRMHMNLPGEEGQGQSTVRK